MNRKNSPPAIGAEWPQQGGWYAGLVRGSDKIGDAHLILVDVHQSLLNWSSARRWAGNEPVTGYAGRLATRAEHSIVRANLSERIRTGIYWTADENSIDGAFAFVTNFDSGSQNCALKRHIEAGAISVRTVPVRGAK